MKKLSTQSTKGLKAIRIGRDLVRKNPILAELARSVSIFPDFSQRDRSSLGWGTVSEDGLITLNGDRPASPNEWAFIISAGLLHLGLGHFKGPMDSDWATACSAFVYRFLSELKIGHCPTDLRCSLNLINGNEYKIYEAIKRNSELKAALAGCSIASPTAAFWEKTSKPTSHKKIEETKWEKLFARGLSQSARLAIGVASNLVDSMDPENAQQIKTGSARAKEWFLSSFPLLGSLAAGFKIIEDTSYCRTLGISIAAVVPGSALIYINPSAIDSEHEMQFVLAHEFLHVALRHLNRCEGRDPFLWNVACDYVINHWLVEMKVGSLPPDALYDEQLKGLSAEAIYDILVKDLRKFRKLATLRGKGERDLIGPGDPVFVAPKAGIDLDAFYRNALSRGLEYHTAAGRGLLPARLVEEIQAALIPPIPWDVKLALWFDEHFKPPEKIRTFARMSRRQAASPDIPRPALYVRDEDHQGHTFGVVLDTSGSMDRRSLALGIGAIASYAMAKEVKKVRLVFCDAQPYDQGFVDVDSLLDRVQIMGRGGTVLQPALDLLQNAADFPKNGPVLIITDGCIEPRLTVTRPHAFLLPLGARLPFAARGDVFYVSE